MLYRNASAILSDAKSMQSESSLMTTAEQSAYRIPYPNSKQRAAKIVALDGPAAQIVDEISKKEWKGARFFTSLSFSTGSEPGGTSEGMTAWLNDLAGRTMDLYEEIASADFVVAITAAGEDACSVTMIGDACRAHSKTLVGLVVPQPGTTKEHIDVSLEHLRPHTRMLVVASGIDYIDVMLTALRA